MLAVPVLAGSVAYAVSEIFKWRASLESKPSQARKFYYVIALATILGVCLNLFGFNPIRALFLSALVNGLVAVPFMFLLMLISMNRSIVGEFQLPLYLRFTGWVATGFMAAASLGFMVSALHAFLSR
jgi:Mn2+/Fe2+ NRAMP family transporter